MKKIKTKHVICIIAILFSAVNGFSQDVIVTKTGEQIRAKIIEVTEDNISYKKYHDQEGATFILKKDNIKIISWENGDVDDYEKKSSVEETVKNNADTVKSEEILPFIDAQAGGFYLNGTSYSEKQLKQFLIEKNLSHIWTKYSSGKNLQIAGLGVLGGGVLLGFSGLALMNGGHVLDALFIGLPFSIIGCLLIDAGIPMAIVGAVRKNRAITDYNSFYGGKSRSQYSQNVTFKAGVVGNGIGFSLNF